MADRRQTVMTLAHPCVALFAATAATAATAAAPNADTRHLSASVQSDTQHNQAVTGLLSMPVGEQWWAQFGAGQTRSTQDAATRRADVVNGGIGVIGAEWQASLSASRRSDGSRLRQTDWAGALDWRGEPFSAGVDAACRTARQTVGAATPAGPAEVPVLQRINGCGLGVHASLQAAPQLSLRAAALHHRYTVTTQQNGAVPGNVPWLPSALQTSPSLVSRDELALSRSGRVGATYRFDKVALSGDLLADKLLDTPGTVRTLQWKAAVAVAARWTITPAFARTRSEVHGGVNFGGLELSHAW